MIQILAANYRGGQLIPERSLDLLDGQKVYLVVAINPEELRSVDRYTAEWEWEPPEVIDRRWQEFFDQPPPEPDPGFEKWERERLEEKRVVVEALRQLWISRQENDEERDEPNSHPLH